MDLTTAKKKLKSNLEEVDKMQKLSNYLLTLNRYQSRNILPTLDLSLKKILLLSVSQVSSQAKNKKIKFETKIEDIVIKGNEDSLTELFTILVENAIKYSGKGKKIILETADLGNHVSVKVTDFGIGIEAEDIPNIFDRFFRGDVSRDKNKTDGYGLGLAIAKSIVDSIRGKISVESKPLRGSTFTVIIPKG